MRFRKYADQLSMIPWQGGETMWSGSHNQQSKGATHIIIDNEKNVIKYMYYTINQELINIFYNDK